MWLKMQFGLVVPLAMTLAQAPQNITLTGERTVGTIAKVNPFETEADVRQGGMLFQTHCSYCHGVRGEGGRGADLTAGEYRLGGSDPDLFNTIRNGIPGSEMPVTRVTDDEVWKLAGFVKRLGSRGLAEKAPGNAAAGKMIYARNGCASCHRIGLE